MRQRVRRDWLREDATHLDGLVSRVEVKHVDLLLGDPRGIRHGGSYAALVDRRVVADDVGRGVPGGECVEQNGHENASASNARLSVAHVRIDRDHLEQVVGPDRVSLPGRCSIRAGTDVR